MSENFDAWVLLTPVNRFYFTKVETSFGCVILAGDRRIFMTDFRYESYARKALPDWEVLLIAGNELYTRIGEVLREVGAKTVGYEDELTVVEYNRLTSCYQAEFISASNEINAKRAVKTDEEIKKIANAQIVAQKSLQQLVSILKPGITEREAAAELLYSMQMLGAENYSFETIVAFGENSAVPHHKTGNRKLEKNDIILIDMGAKVEGYCSDMTRTFCLGDPGEELKKIHAVVLEAQQYALKNYRAGLTGREADSLAREYITSKGYGKFFGHSLGHGVGVEIHEFPRLSSLSDDLLKPNMIVTCEPGIYIEGLGGVRIEDIVVVKENGILNLTNFNKNLNL